MGLRVRIVNLAVRMLQDPHFDVERYLAKLNPAAFGIDLHWLPHAHGAIEIARVVKRLHPRTPVIFGGFSSTYFHLDSDSASRSGFCRARRFDRRPDAGVEPVHRVGRRGAPGAELGRGAHDLPSSPTWCGATRKTIRTSTRSPTARTIWTTFCWTIPTSSKPSCAIATWRALSRSMPGCAIPSRRRSACAAAATTAPRAAARRVLTTTCTVASVPPIASRKIWPTTFAAWAGSARGRSLSWATSARRATNTPTVSSMRSPGYKKPVFIELFDATPPGFFKKVAHALPNFTVEISLESHDDHVRRAFGRPYTTAAIERSMDEALDAGCQRLDLFFMTGLREQTYDSVMGTVDYCGQLLKRYAAAGDTRVIPFISPLAPFVDPGSRAFEEPERYGYRLFCRTLEEHRQALLAPSWKYVLNYETEWMNRDEIVASTYEAGRRMNLLKAEYGVIEASVAEATDKRIAKAVALEQRD